MHYNHHNILQLFELTSSDGEPTGRKYQAEVDHLINNSVI